MPQHWKSGRGRCSRKGSSEDAELFAVGGEFVVEKPRAQDGVVRSQVADDPVARAFDGTRVFT